MIALFLRTISVLFALDAFALAEERNPLQTPAPQTPPSGQNGGNSNMAEPTCQPWPTCIIYSSPFQPGAPGPGLKSVGETIDRKDLVLSLPAGSA